MAVGFSLFVVAQLMAEVNAGKPETDVKGCWCKYNGNSGQISPTPFIKTGDKEAPDEQGRAEVWGFIVEDVGKYEHKVYADGTIRPVNILAEMFVPADNKAHEVATGTRTKMYVCRVWSQQPAQSADK